MREILLPVLTPAPVALAMEQNDVEFARHGAISQMKMVPVSPLTDFSFDFRDLLFTPVVIPGAASAAHR
jgi:hypothetical protein